MTFPRAFVLIMVGVAAWGLFHAVGAYLYNHDMRRFFFVIGCVVAFLGFWGVMLASRKRRLDREAADV